MSMAAMGGARKLSFSENYKQDARVWDAKCCYRSHSVNREMETKKGTERTRFPIGCVPSPRVQRQTCYCMLVKAWQAARVVTGTLPARPGLKRITPSSVEQKFRTPVMS